MDVLPEGFVPKLKKRLRSFVPQLKQSASGIYMQEASLSTLPHNAKGMLEGLLFLREGLFHQSTPKVTLYIWFRHKGDMTKCRDVAGCDDKGLL